jgi:hypothetical protein
MPNYFAMSLKTKQVLALIDSCLDVGDFHVEVEGLAGEGMIQIDHDGFVLDLVNAHGDGLPLQALRHQHGSDL